MTTACDAASAAITTPSTNPLLATAGIPLFGEIRPEHVEPAVSTTLAALRDEFAHLANATTVDIAWLQSCERLHERLQRVWGPITHLASVASTPALRDTFNRCLEQVSDFRTDLGQNAALFAQFQRLDAALPSAARVERELVTQTLRDFRLGGVALPTERKARFKEVMQALSAREAQFEQNLMDAAAAFTHHETDAAELAGIPQVVLAGARAAAQNKGLEGWLFALDLPTYSAILAHADSEPLRRCFYRAWVTRASEQNSATTEWDNGPVMVDILALRHESAKLLEFGNFAELSLATKMVDRPETVLDFLRDLTARSKALAQREIADLANFANKPLAAWDVAYFAEKLRRNRFALDQEALRPYFPLPRVLDGLFGLVERLFGLHIQAGEPLSAWAPEVALYEIRDRDGVPVGSLITDLFARPNKRGGAWMDTCLDRARLPGLVQNPVAHLVCNFTSPVGEGPAQLTHREVVTLFHEFGHSLHHLLTRVDYPSLAGINGVEWDAVELPSQLFENFAWLPEVLKTLSSHVETQTPLSDDLITQLNVSRAFHAGIAMQRQLEFALFDLHLHARATPPTFDDIYTCLGDVQREVLIVTPPEWNRFANGFSHIFGGGYAAGYYSYKWAEVLAADAFSAFEAEGVWNPATAARYEDSILAVGGSRPTHDSFVAFRGREPELGPLLVQAGIATNT